MPNADHRPFWHIRACVPHISHARWPPPVHASLTGDMFMPTVTGFSGSPIGALEPSRQSGMLCFFEGHCMLIATRRFAPCERCAQMLSGNITRSSLPTRKPSPSESSTIQHAVFVQTPAEPGSKRSATLMSVGNSLFESNEQASTSSGVISVAIEKHLATSKHAVLALCIAPSR